MCARRAGLTEFPIRHRALCRHDAAWLHIIHPEILPPPRSVEILGPAQKLGLQVLHHCGTKVTIGLFKFLHVIVVNRPSPPRMSRSKAFEFFGMRCAYLVAFEKPQVEDR